MCDGVEKMGIGSDVRWACLCVSQREDDERLDEIGYDDVGGCKKQLAMIRELVRPLTIPPAL